MQTYKQIKSSISKKALEALPEARRQEFYQIKASCITNVLRAYFKQKQLEEAASTFLEFSPENDTDLKFLDIGFEILLAKNKEQDFEDEVQRITTRYLFKSPEFVEKFTGTVVNKFRQSFNKKKLKAEQEMRANVQMMLNERLNRQYEENNAVFNRLNQG